MATTTDFGTPSGSPAAGGAFQGLYSDFALARVTDPTLSNFGRRVILAGLGAATTSCSSDVVVAVSDDAGATFGHAQYANDPTVANNADAPRIHSHEASPYSTYVTWNTNNFSSGFIAQVGWSGDFTFSRGPTRRIPSAPLELVKFPAVSVGMINACEGPMEAVYVTWMDNGGMCTSTTNDNQETAVNLRVAVYAPAADRWYGPFTLDTDPKYPKCIGQPLFSGRSSYNSIHNSIASDPTGTTVIIGYTKSSQTGTGTRVRTSQFQIICGGGSGTPSPVVHWTAPEPGVQTGTFGPTGSGGTSGAGGAQVNDQWDPSVAFTHDTSGASKAVLAWFDTRDDINNVLTNVYATYSENGGNAWSAIMRLTSKNAPTEIVPFDHTLGDTWDYNLIGTHPSGVFLSTWGGDTRLGATGNQGVWSAVIQ